MAKPPPPTKSERTRSKILAAARKSFASRGFERTTIRQVAATAGVDPALVMRYFGSKDELFAEAAEFTFGLADFGAVERADIGRTLVDRYLRLWEGGVEGLPILLRSATSNAHAAERMREIFATQIVPAIAAASGPRGVRERAGLVASQLLGMALCRFILKLPPVVAMPRDRLVREVGETVQRYVEG